MNGTSGKEGFGNYDGSINIDYGINQVRYSESGRLE